MFGLTGKSGAFGDGSGYDMREILGHAIVPSMNRAGQVLIWFAILAIAAVAIGATGSVWAGLIVATIELGFCRLLRSRWHPR